MSAKDPAQEARDAVAAAEEFLKQLKHRQDMYDYGTPLKVLMLKLLGYKTLPVTTLSLDFVKVYADGTTKMERISLARLKSPNIIQT